MLQQKRSKKDEYLKKTDEIRCRKIGKAGGEGGG